MTVPSEYGVDLAAIGARFDHTGIAVPRIAAALPIYMGLLGGRFLLANIEEDDGFAAVQLLFGENEKFEIIQPYGASSPLHHYLSSCPDGGLHHVTFKVADVRATISSAQAMGLDVVGIALEKPYWQQAYLHPRTAQGVLVQIVQSDVPFPGNPDMTLERLLQRLEHA